MSTNTPSGQGRRSILAAAFGAATAALAGALGRPRAAYASDPNDVVLGADNTSGTTTLIRNTTTANAAFKGMGATGDGVVGESAGNFRSGVLGRTSATNASGVIGEGGAGASIVSMGRLGGGDGVGVHGWSQAGTGVRAESAGTALEVIGKARFSRSGRVKMAAGTSYVDIDLTSEGGLDGTPLLFASLQTYRQGVYVAATRPNYPSAGTFRIYLNKELTAASRVAWQVLG